MYDMIAGDNICLRKARESDFESMRDNVWGDEDVYKWMLFAPALTEEDAVERCRRSILFQKDHFAYFVALKDTDEAIGMCAISETGAGHFEESGICIGKRYQGRGYGKEILSLLLDLAFDKLGAEDFRYGYFENNTRSGKLAEHFGFRYDRTYELTREYDGSSKKIRSCVLSRDDYFFRRQRQKMKMPGFIAEVLAPDKRTERRMISQNMELFNGSPSDTGGRSERERRAYAFLDELGIAFERTDHPDRPATSMDVCADVDAVLGVHICKNLFLCNRQKTDFYLLIMPGDKPFRTKELSKQIGTSRLSFADESAMERYLDVHPGSVSILGLMNDTEHRVRLLIDEDVLKETMFGCHPCENTSSIRFAVKDLTEKIIPSLGVDPIIVRLTGTE